MAGWYIPSFYGDISIERADKGSIIEWHDLTALEKEALGKLKALCEKKSWGEIDLDKAKQTLVDAPFEELHQALAKHLKGGKKTLSAIVFKDGKIVESSVLADAAAGTTVAVPTKGCPQPDFDDVEIRATRVLERFLSPEQLADFRKHNAFTVIGADTGHAYQLTSRNARALCMKFGQVYDIDEREMLCVHDWEAPAAEELLGLKLHIELSGNERYVRDLPHLDA